MSATSATFAMSVRATVAELVKPWLRVGRVGRLVSAPGKGGVFRMLRLATEVEGRFPQERFAWGL